MKRNVRFRRAGLGSLLYSSLVVVALGAGCPGPEVDRPDEDGGASKRGEQDRDAGHEPILDAGQDAGQDAGEVVPDELTAVIAPIADGNLDSTFMFDGEGSLNPDARALSYAWELEGPDGDGCEGELTGAATPKATFTPTCRGDYEVTLTISLVDGSDSSTAVQTFVVANRLPVLSGLALEAAFLPGEDVVISATVTDEDEPDQPTCTARLAGDSEGDPAGLVIPSEPSADCRFTISTPPRVDTWKIEVVANDGFDDSLPVTIELGSESLPPVISSVEVDLEEVGYSCDAEGCVSDPVRVTVSATDDVDPFEDLVIVVEDASTDMPAGVTLTATAVAGEHGVFDVVVSRPDLGPVAGDFVVLARVTEVTNGVAPGSVEGQASFAVNGEAPAVATITAPDSPHVFNAGEGRYEAVLGVTASGSDPEGNTTSVSISLISCPAGAIGDPACGGAELTIAESGAAGDVELALSATDLASLVGGFTFAVTVTDADGLSTTEEEVVQVLNAAPTLSTAFVDSAQQAYTSGSHRAVFPLVQDAENDPLTLTLSATCANGSTISSLPGSCSSGQTLAVGDDGRLTVTGPAPGLLGEYRVQGTVSDGAAQYALDVTVEVQNTAPTIARSSAASVTCHHKTTSGTTTTNEAGCSFPLDGNASDANGDPLTYTLSLSPDNDYTITGSLSGAVPGDGALDLSFGLSTSYTNFVETFADQTQRARVTVSDPFGAVASATMTPKLNNRAPTVSSYTWRNADGTAAPAALANSHVNTSSERAYSPDTCRNIGLPGGPTVRHCTKAAPYRFALNTSASDPDGDPLEVRLDATCHDNVMTEAGASLSSPIALPTNGLIPLKMPGTWASCGVTQNEGSTHWNFDFTGPGCQLPGGCWPAKYEFGCTLDGGSTFVTDGVQQTPFGADATFDAGLAGASTDPPC